MSWELEDFEGGVYATREAISWETRGRRDIEMSAGFDSMSIKQE